MSTVRPQRDPSPFWKPVTSGTGDPSCPSFHGKNVTAGGCGGVRFQDPWLTTIAPVPNGAGNVVNDSPSGAECAGSPCSMRGSAAQSSFAPVGFVSGSLTNGRSAKARPERRAPGFRLVSGSQYGQ